MAWILWWLLFNSEANYRHLFPGLLFGILPLARVLTWNGKSILLKFAQTGMIVFMLAAVFSPAGPVKHFSGLESAYNGQRAQMKFAEYVAHLEPEAQIFGIGWFMAWDIAFLSNRVFGDLDSPPAPIGPTSYVVVTPTIRRYPEAYSHAQRMISAYSGEVNYEDTGYVLYKLHP